MADTTIRVITDKENIVPIADKVRMLDGTTTEKTLGEMVESIDEANAEIATQAAKIAELSAILDGKISVSPVIIPIEITKNGTYTVPEGVDGYGPIVVNVASASELPEGYIKLTYLQSSGTQYIDTGYKPNNNTRVVVDCQLLSLDGVTSQGLHIASVTGDGYYWTLFGYPEEKIGSRYGTQSAQYFSAGAPTWNERMIYDKNKNVTTVGGYSISANT